MRLQYTTVLQISPENSNNKKKKQLIFLNYVFLAEIVGIQEHTNRYICVYIQVYMFETFDDLFMQ